MPSDGGCIHSETRRCEQCAEIATLRSERDTALAELAEARKKLERDRARFEAELAEVRRERDALMSDLVQANGRVNEERYDHAETCLDLEAVKAARLAALDGQIAAESRLAQAEAALSYADRLLGEHPKLTCAPGAHSPEASGPCEECEWVGAVFRHLQHRAALSPPTTGEKK